MQRSALRRVFTYILAALAGVAGTLLGWVIVGLLADLLLGLGGMSDREGGRAMVAFFTYGLFGGLAGLILGIWLVLRYFGGYTGFARIAGRGALVAAGIAAAMGLGLWACLLSDHSLARNGPPPQLKFELRLPAGTTLPDKLEGVSMDLNTDKNTMPALLTDSGTENRRPSIAGVVDLYFRTRSRLLVLRMQGEPDRLFMLKLASNPPASAEFGPWQPVDHIADGPHGELRKPGPDDAYEIRYRVERAD